MHMAAEELDVEPFAASYILAEYCIYGSASVDSFLTDCFLVFLPDFHHYTNEMRATLRSGREHVQRMNELK